jgi:16S rRNA G1207 methylase RsmC
VVANRHLPHAETLKKRFGGVSVVASERKFVILSTVKKIISVWGAVKLPENQ